jgi:tetratricopeptide (TPR) repeat protein
MGTSRHADARRRRVITLEDRDFIFGAAAWTAKTDVSTVDVGLSPDEAIRRAPDFLRVLREGKISPADPQLDNAGIDVLHAACRLLAEPNAGAVEEPLDSVRALYDFIEKVTWLGPDFDERAELQGACAFAGWRIARGKATLQVTDEWQKRLFAATPKALLRTSSLSDNVSRGSIGISARAKTDPIPSVDDPETLLPLLDVLRLRAETSPAEVLDEATFVYRYLENLQPRYPMDAFLLDEREYFLGETARIVGAASRILARREEAKRWLDLADGWFLLTENASGNLSKVMYQRLAVRVEERDFDGVSALLPQLITSFDKLGMREDVLKARFLHAVLLREIDDVPSAISVYQEIADEAKELKNDPLRAHAYTNLVQLYGFQGAAPEAFAMAKEAMPLLRKLGNQVAIAKLQWGLAYLQRTHGDTAAAIETFRSAQQEFAELAMRADVAAVHLVIADLLLDAGKEKQAESEIRQALPLIDEYRLVPEGFAAMTLLRESLRRQKIDREALRNLHEHFEKKKP